MANPIVLLCKLHAPTQKILEEQFEVHRLYEASDPDAMIAQLADKVEVAVTMSGIGIDVMLMQALPNIKLAANFGVGIDPISLPDCTANGVTVTNTPDVLTEDVADMALGLLLSSMRQINLGDHYVRSGQWKKDGPMPLTVTLQGKKVGVVGLGRIGRAIAKRCEAFNTSISYFGPRKKTDVSYTYHDDVVSLAQWADVVIAACPGGPETAGIVSADALKALGPDGVFVNIARGSVVDQDALVSLLQSGGLAGAGLDVFANEPDVPKALIDMPHVVLQPHQGSATHSTRMAMGQLVIDNVQAWFDKKPLITAMN